MPGAAVYLWHCDRDGNGTRCTRRAPPTRTTCAACRRPRATGPSRSRAIFPAAYSGRWPHMHFEVYPSLAEATKRRHTDRDLAARVARGLVQPRVRDRRLRAERHEPGPDLARPPTWSSATASRNRLATVTGTVDDGYDHHAERSRLGRAPSTASTRATAAGRSGPSARSTGCTASRPARATQVLLVQVPLASRAHARVRGRERRRPLRLPAHATASSRRAWASANFRPPTASRRQNSGARARSAVGEVGTRQRSHEVPVERELGRVAVRRRARDVADLPEDAGTVPASASAVHSSTVARSR